MALPPLPENNTARLMVYYTTGRREHAIQVRYVPPASVDDATDLLLAFLTPIVNYLPTTWAVLRAEHQEAGAIVRFPVTLGSMAGFSGTNGATLNEAVEPREYRWMGRGLVSGRRTSVSLYGVLLTSPGNYRFTEATMPSEFLTTISVLQSAPAAVATTIAGDEPAWKPYINVNYNSHWETEARG